MADKNTLTGHLACFTAYFIFGLNIVICKDLSASGAFSPLCIFTFRAMGATSVFWLLDALFPKGRIKVDRKDFAPIFLASMLGLFLTQIAFLIGIGRTTPLDWSILSVLSPVFTMFAAAFFQKEPITLKKAGGVALSFAGVICLILGSTHTGGTATTSVSGILLGLLNAGSFALYLGIFRPLIQKYRVITFMKWMFLFSLLVSLPFTIKEIFTADYASVPMNCYLELGFLIIFATIIAYFLIPLGQKHIRPTIVSLYSYVQPILAAGISIWMGMDRLTVFKVVSAAAVVSGVLIVNKSRAASH